MPWFRRRIPVWCTSGRGSPRTRTWTATTSPPSQTGRPNYQIKPLPSRINNSYKISVHSGDEVMATFNQKNTAKIFLISLYEMKVNKIINCLCRGLFNYTTYINTEFNYYTLCLPHRPQQFWRKGNYQMFTIYEYEKSLYKHCT